MAEPLQLGLYRAKTAHWADGSISTFYAKEKGQGAKILIELSPEKAVELGKQYVMQLAECPAAPPVVPEPPVFPGDLPTPELPPVTPPMLKPAPIPRPKPGEKPTTLPSHPPTTLPEEGGEDVAMTLPE